MLIFNILDLFHNFLQQDFIIDLRNGCGPSDAKLQ